MSREDGVDPRVVRDVLERCAQGVISPPVAAMTILLVAGGDDPLGAAMRAVDHEATAAAVEVARLLRDHGPRCLAVAARARGPAAVEVGSIAALFDAAALESEEAAVALYSLGDPELLGEATRELVTVLASFGVLGADRVALDLGCGIGRVAAALGPHLASIHGIDVSARMIAAARRRCAGMGNVSFSETTGRDLRLFEDGYFDLVLAVDSLPYLHAAGLLDACFDEIARVLRPGGDLVAVNLSYRGDLPADRAEARRLGEAFGFEIIVEGARPFTLWDGVAFHLRRRSVRGARMWAGASPRG